MSDKIDWRKQIQIAKTRNKGTFDSLAKLYAASWFACACGSQDDRIQRFGMSSASDLWNAPIDEKMRNLGKEFHACVSQDDIDGAQKFLKLIETRAKELLETA